MENKSTITTIDYVFKDSVSYLNEDNWRNYFGEALPSGFIGCPFCEYSNGTVNSMETMGMVFGSKFNSPYNLEITTPVTSEEYDCLYVYTLVDGHVALEKISNINSSEAGWKRMLAILLLYSANSPKNLAWFLKSNGLISGDFALAGFYAVYGVGCIDLAKQIKRSGEIGVVEANVTTGTSSSVSAPTLGRLTEYGLAQIYGGYRYNLTIDENYAENQYILYPVPACSMESAIVRIKNNSGKQITVKVPKEYKGLTFDYVHDGVWIEGQNDVSFSLPDDGDVVMTFAQTGQNNPYETQIDIPISYYTITQNLRNDDPGEGYTKAEANAIFATQAQVEDKVDSSDLGELAFMDTSDFGDLATKDSVNYETEVTNKPTLGSMSSSDDAPSNDKSYGRKNGEWSEVVSNEELTDAGDLVMHDSKLYRCTKDWNELEVVEITASGSITQGQYATDINHLYLYMAVATVSWSTTTAEEARQTLYDNGQIYGVNLVSYDPFKSDYAQGNFMKLPNGTFVQLNGTCGVFSPTTVEEELASKIGVEALNDKAPLNSPAFSGTPTAPTPVSTDNSTKIATTAYVKSLLPSMEGMAPIDSPDFTGTPTAPTPAPSDNSTKIATTAYVKGQIPDISGKADLASPDFTGTPTATTPANTDNSTRIATTAYVKSVVSGKADLISPTFTGTPQAPTPSNSDNSTRIATTAYVQNIVDAKIPTVDSTYTKSEADAKFAVKNSPAFTGTPTAPTPDSNDNSTKIATTAFVKGLIPSVEEIAPIDSPVFTGTPSAPTPAISDNSTKLATTAFVRNIMYSSEAPEYYVDYSTGNDTYDGLSIQTPFKTLQKAIDSCPNGIYSIIHVVPNTYQKIEISKKKVRIIGTYDGQLSISQNSNSVDYAMRVTEGSYVELVGNLLISSSGDPLYISQNSCVSYTRGWSQSSQQLILQSNNSNSSTSSRGVYLDSGKFVTENVKIIRFGSTGANARGIQAVNGSYVNADNITVEGINQGIAIVCDGSIVSYGIISGSYSTLSEITNGGIVSSAPFAQLVSPAFTGTPTAPTPETTDDSTKIATTKFVKNAISGKADLVSPVFTGTPTAPTQANSDFSTKIATTAFVKNAIAHPNTEYYVDASTGSDTNDGLSIQSPFKTLQKAIDMCVGGVYTRIKVVPSTYSNVSISSKNIKIEGTYDGIITISGTLYSIQVQNGSNVVLSGNIKCYGTLSIASNSALSYERGWNSTTNKLETYESASDSGVITTNLVVKDCSKFSSEAVKFTRNGANTESTDSTAAYVINGSYASLGNVTIQNINKVIECYGSIVLYNSISGSYRTLSIITNGGIVNGGN